MTETLMRRETGEAAAVIRGLFEREDAALQRIAGLIANAAGPITTAARGSSDHAVTAFKYACEILLGRPVASIGPSVASIYAARLALQGGIHITVSQSGASPDIVELQAAASRGGATTIAVVNVVNSPLAKDADVVVPLHAGDERSVAATKTFVGSCAALLAMTGLAAPDDALIDGLKRLPAALDAIPPGVEDALATSLAGAGSLYVTGRGPAFGIALEAALKAKETAGIHAEAFSVAELMHGPLQLVQSGFPVVVFVSDDASRDGTLAAIERLRGLGGEVMPVSTLDLPGGLLVPSTGHGFSDALVFAAVWYRAIEQAARLRGHDPDRPANLRKVTETV